MPYAVLVIKTDGTIVKTVQPKKPNYKQLNEAVGGYIETLPYFTRVVHEGVEYKRGTAFCHEEGKVRGMAVNARATALWIMSCPEGDPGRMVLAGDVIFYAKVK